MRPKKRGASGRPIGACAEDEGRFCPDAPAGGIPKRAFPCPCRIRTNRSKCRLCLRAGKSEKRAPVPDPHRTFPRSEPGRRLSARPLPAATCPPDRPTSARTWGQRFCMSLHNHATEHSPPSPSSTERPVLPPLVWRSVRKEFESIENCKRRSWNNPFLPMKLQFNTRCTVSSNQRAKNLSAGYSKRPHRRASMLFQPLAKKSRLTARVGTNKGSGRRRKSILP